MVNLSLMDMKIENKRLKLLHRNEQIDKEKQELVHQLKRQKIKRKMQIINKFNNYHETKKHVEQNMAEL